MWPGGRAAAASCAPGFWPCRCARRTSNSAAQPPPPAETVTTLLAKGYQVVSSYQSQIGPGLFLQRVETLYLCFVQETPNTPELRTQYCKPVR